MIKDLNKYILKNKIYLILFLFLLISSMSYWYGDTLSNVRHSMNIWKALFEGRFFEFYSYNLDSYASGATPHGGGYEVFIYMILAVWNLPLYIIEKFIGGDILTYFPARVYAKLFLIILTFIAGKLTEQIAIHFGLNEDKAEESFFLFTGSAVVFSSVSVVGQIDIVGLVFILLAFLAYIKEENLKFYLLFIFAYQCKFFALFIFIPLILLKEKKLLKIIFKIGLPILITYIINIPFKLADLVGVNHKMEPTGVVIEEMLALRFEFMGQNLPYIFLLFGAVCMLTFLIKVYKDYKDNLIYIYFAYIGLASVLLLSASPYRMIYIMPFMVILLVSKEGNYNVRFILFNAVMVSLIIGYLIEFRWCYDFGIMYNMLCDILIPFHKFELLSVEQLSNIIRGEQFYNIWTIFYSMFVVYTIGFAIIHFPGRKECIIFSDCDKLNGEKMEKKKYLFVFLINYLVTNIAVVLLIFSVIRNIIYKFY